MNLMMTTSDLQDFGADSDDDVGRKGSGGASIPSSIIVQFYSLDGEDKGPQIDVPVGSTVVQMEELVNQLLENKDKVPKDGMGLSIRRGERLPIDSNLVVVAT